MLRKNDSDETDLAWICATFDNSVPTYEVSLVKLSEKSRGFDRGS